KSKRWFRKGKLDSYLKGKQVHDYVSEAIEKFLKNPGNFDSSKRSLVNYIKLHIIRTLIWNDNTATENLKMSDIDLYSTIVDDEEHYQNLDAILPYANTYFDQQIDYDQILKAIEREIIDDSIVSKIFEGYCTLGLKRREIIMMFNMDSGIYDNGMKRLRTIIKRTA